MKTCGVYKITSPSGRIYVGSSKHIEIRHRVHKNGGKKIQPRLYNSIQKYGWEVHTFEIIAITEPEQRYKWEHILGIYYNVLGKDGLNCQLPGYNDIPAVTRQETKDKIGNSNRGRVWTEEAKKKASDSHKGQLVSEETRNKLSLMRKGKKQNPVGVAKRAELLKGRKSTEEQRDTMRKAKAFISDETRTKIAKSKIGKKQTSEHIKNMVLTKYKPLLDLSTGIFYDYIGEALQYATHFSKGHLRRMLNNEYPNKTTLIYI